ncbi:MAG: hypothetical protein M0R73_00765 [Dehalococcoidia bacterium]|nr:hypothetical protein [Dehalococcoidia bacterium]
MRPPTIAGALVILVAGVIIAGVWALGGTEGEASPNGGPTATETAVIEGPRARVALTSNLYGAPSRAGELVAIVPEGREVRVTGRSDDSSWIRVIYPVASTLEGWLPATNLVEASLPELAAVPDVATIGGPDGEDGGGSLVDEPGLPDLTVSSADVGATGILTVRITNVGRGAFSGSVALRVTTAEGEIVGALDIGPLESLGSGRSASVNTGVVVRETGLFVIEVDPNNQVEESSEFNNSRRVVLVGTGS